MFYYIKSFQPLISWPEINMNSGAIFSTTILALIRLIQSAPPPIQQFLYTLANNIDDTRDLNPIAFFFNSKIRPGVITTSRKVLEQSTTLRQKCSTIAIPIKSIYSQWASYSTLSSKASMRQSTMTGFMAFLFVQMADGKNLLAFRCMSKKGI